MTIAKKVLEAGVAISEADETSLPTVLRDFFSAFIGKPYVVSRAALVLPDGQDSDTFAAVVAAVNDGEAFPLDVVPAARAAVVIDAHQTLTSEALRASYARIATAKRLRRATMRPDPNDRKPGQRDELVGVLMGLRADLSLDAIADEMQRLNEQVPAHEWPDMIVVVNTGMIQYAVQFPGENLVGDFLLPEAPVSYCPPMYIVTVMKPTGKDTLNRMLSSLVAHLALFDANAQVPKFPDIVDGIPNNAVTLFGYQCNLAGELVSVPRQFYNDRYLAPAPFIVKRRDGTVIATVQFLPWQDGGVILIHGQLPMKVLLTFLRPATARAKGLVNRQGAQISYAMPIKQRDFLQMLERLREQTNVLVQPDDTGWVVKKFSEEGSSSPFMARILMGTMRLRDAALPERADRDRFDDAYKPVTTGLFDARSRATKVLRLWETHLLGVTSGRIARVQGYTIHVTKNVDGDLGDEVDAFINATLRALKTGMQTLCADLGVNIGFLFMKQAAFDAALATLAANDPALADYVRETRSRWSGTLVDRRNAVEHKGWRLDDVRYERDGNRVVALEPTVDGMPVTQFATFMLDRLTCFVEEVTAHLLQRRLIEGITITELPRGARLDEAPERFRVTLAVGGLPQWRISYHAASFEET